MCPDVKYFKLIPEDPAVMDGKCYDLDGISIGGSLKSPVRFTEARRIAADSNIQIYSDLNGDGELDYFSFSIEPSPFINLDCEFNRCTLFLPDGPDGIDKILAGKTSTLGNTDIYVLTNYGQEILLKNIMDERVPVNSSSDLVIKYENHLLGLKNLLKQGLWSDALYKSIEYNLGISHTWVVDEPTKDPFTWLFGKPAYTDCITEIERVLSEMNSSGPTLSNVAATLKNIQFYDLDGSERTDFFALEAIPHLTEMGVIEDITNSLHLYITGLAAPVIEYKVDKINWYAYCKNEDPGKDIPVWQGKLNYYPFDEMLETDNYGTIRFKEAIVNQLDPVTIFAVMNKGRFFQACKTEIPTSHTGFFVKKDNEVFILHSTPVTDVGLTSVTYETVDSFFKTRYVDVTGPQEKMTLKDSTATGMKLIQIKKK